MTPNEEMKIREAWGDYVMLRGWPAFRDGNRASVPIIRDVSPMFDEEMGPDTKPVVDSYEFKASKIDRINEYEHSHYIEVTIECQSVVVHREWKRL